MLVWARRIWWDSCWARIHSRPLEGSEITFFLPARRMYGFHCLIFSMFFSLVARIIQILFLPFYFSFFVCSFVRVTSFSRFLLIPIRIGGKNMIHFFSEICIFFPPCMCLCIEPFFFVTWNSQVSLFFFSFFFLFCRWSRNDLIDSLVTSRMGTRQEALVDLEGQYHPKKQLIMDYSRLHFGESGIVRYLCWCCLNLLFLYFCFLAHMIVDSCAVGSRCCGFESLLSFAFLSFYSAINFSSRIYELEKMFNLSAPFMRSPMVFESSLLLDSVFDCNIFTFSVRIFFSFFQSRLF